MGPQGHQSGFWPAVATQAPPQPLTCGRPTQPGALQLVPAGLVSPQVVSERGGLPAERVAGPCQSSSTVDDCRLDMCYGLPWMRGMLMR